GDVHALEAARRLHGAGMLDGPDLGDPYEVPQGHDADELPVVDHRHVPVAVLGETVERVVDVDLGVDGVGFLGHPFGDLGDRGVGARSGDFDHVALGEDANRTGRVDRGDGHDLDLACA